MTDRHVAEIVTFRLVGGSDPAAFWEAAEQMAPFLRRTGGMIARTLSCDGDGLWTDHILWDSLADADRAATALPDAPEAAGMMAPIDMGTVTLRHAEVAVTQS